MSIPERGEVRGRNAWLIQTALVASPIQSGVLVIGIHAGNSYIDCSSLFAERTADLVALQTAGQIQLFTPFLTWSKADIWNYAQHEGLPLELTYCERGLDQPCDGCDSCTDSRELSARS